MTNFEKSMKLCASIACFCFLSAFCNKVTDGFSIRAISSVRPPEARYTTRPLSLEEKNTLQEALHQPYTYYGCGGQAYAFFSQDGKYVIKFFKQRLFRRSWLLNHFPLPQLLRRYRAKRNWKRDDKFARDFMSYKIAFDELQAQTGVIYVHLNPTSYLKHKLQIEGPLHIFYQLNLDDFDFIVQKRAQSTHATIIEHMESGAIEQAKSSIESLLKLISYRCQKGYRDRDPNIRTNCGFFEGQAVKIDVGRFVRCEEMKMPQNHNRDIFFITSKFEKWLENTYPELVPFLIQKREEILL